MPFPGNKTKKEIGKISNGFRENPFFLKKCRKNVVRAMKGPEEWCFVGFGLQRNVLKADRA